MDIITLPIEYDKKKIESKYRLAVIASQRARELALGSDPKLAKKAKKVTTSSLLETVSGEVKFITGDDAAAAREKADRIDFKKLIEERRKTSVGDLSELEKDLRFICMNGKAHRNMRWMNSLPIQKSKRATSLHRLPAFS